MQALIARLACPNISSNLIQEAFVDKTYSPNEIEAHWSEAWEARGHFAPSGQGDPYCIMIPPPNVTGTLHMGHAFQDTIMDALTRYQRMKGRNTLWQPGCDHAGIATQMVVERQINSEGLTRQDLGREAFVKRIWEWKEVSGDTITNQLRRMGASVDWAHERFTMDTGCSEAVTETFVRLYEEGLIYRGKRLVNWDPVLRTAVSDLEVLSEEEDGSLWHIRYPLADGSGHLTVATTRPETMLGDTAVAVNPDNERTRHFIGKEVELPLTDRRISVIADDYVDAEFGTGCLKITPAHDFNDYVVAERHGLDRVNIFTPDAHINDTAPERYRGLDRFEARKRIVQDLEARGLMEKIVPHKLMVPRGDRSHAVIEPYLTDQWYVKAAPLAKAAIEAVENGDIRFVPEHWSKTYFEWMRNIEDWCISRQIWWGHRVPAWYDPDGNVYVARTEAEARQKHGLPASLALAQDTDVLDTWYSSALWPFSTLGWPEQTERLETFYPTTVLVTGFDIIFFWVARMVMFGLKFMGKVPFSEVYIHGLVRDADGNKMSKSKGNVLDPMDLVDGISLDALIAKRTTGLMQPHLAPGIVADTRRQFPDGIAAFGTDALRFTFCSLATQGRDIRFDLGRIEGYRNFCNKLWNAARFVAMNVEGEKLDDDSPPTIAERWVRARLRETIETVERSFAQYRFDLAAQAIYEFTWHEYCDWYLEIAKSQLRDESLGDEVKRSIRCTLVGVLESLLRVAHPFMPYITEAIWQQVGPLAGVQDAGNDATIMRQGYPSADEFEADAGALDQIDWLKSVVLALRKIRGELNVKPGHKLNVLFENASEDDRARAGALAAPLAALAGVESVDFPEDGAAASEAAFALVGNLKVKVPLAGLIDAKAEMARQSRDLEKLDKDIARTESKLSNPKFVERAPAEVVEKERQRLSEMGAARLKLETQLAQLARL